MNLIEPKLHGISVKTAGSVLKGTYLLFPDYIYENPASIKNGFLLNKYNHSL